MIRIILQKIKRKWIVKHDHPDERRLRAWYKKYRDIEVGKYTYGLWGADIAPKTKIGAFCSIAPNVKIGLMNHPMDYVSTHPFLYYKDRGFVDSNLQITQKSAPIIEDDVWIGTNAVILPGVRIGRGAVIAAGAVVSKDVEPYACMGGVPAKCIKYRFPKETREKLLKVNWAEKDDEWIKEHIELFYDVDKFINKIVEEGAKK